MATARSCSKDEVLFLEDLPRPIRHGGEQIEVHDYLSSLPLGVKRFARAARGHQGIENRWHWSLDVVFAQDGSRIRKGASPEIASMLRQLAMMIFQQGHSAIGKPALQTQAGRLEQPTPRIALLAQFTPK